MPDANSSSRALRWSVGSALIAITFSALLAFGLSITSASIEVVAFIWAVVMWIFFGNRRKRGVHSEGLKIGGVFGRKLDVDQKGSTAEVGMAVGEDVRIRQRQKR